MTDDLDKRMAKYEGPYLEGVDMADGAEVSVTIQDVVAPGSRKSADGQLIEEPILVFENTTKQLIVNKTNYRMLKALHGPRASGWKGKQITIGKRYLEKAFGRRNVPTIRIIPPKGTPVPFSVYKHMGQKDPFKT